MDYEQDGYDKQGDSVACSPLGKMKLNREFCKHLEDHQLSILDVALVAKVRLLVVWRIQHNLPVSQDHTDYVRFAIYQLTGIPYRLLIEVVRKDG